jgi:hypothetical protein
MRQRDRTPLWQAALVVVAVPSVLFVVGAVAIKKFGVHVPLAVGLTLVLLVGLAFLLLVFAAIVDFFPAGSTGERADAFGLPPGSIRAVLAVGSFVLFLIIVVYLFTSVLKADGTEAKTAATTVIGALVTLIGTVSAFYFGASSVKTATQALAAITGQSPPPPEAITKGSEPDPTDPNMTDLVGNVNPHGQEVRSFYEYSDKEYDVEPTTYSGGVSEVRTVSPGDTAVEVRIPVAAKSLSDRYWFRIVAVGPNGTAFGRGEQVKIPLPKAAPAVTGVAPFTGAATGGQSVTITGRGFTGATGVSFGAAAATAVDVVSDTQVTCTSPQGSGTVHVTVTTPAGTSATGESDRFTYK